MARSKNTLTDVSPASGQLKSSFSNLERTQLDALKQTSGSLGYGAGNINGSVTNALQNFSYRDRAKLEIGGLFAEGLEKAGLSRKSSSSVISSVVSSSIENRKPFYRNTPTKEIDLSIAANRVPDPFQKSPVDEIKEKRQLLVGRDDLGYNGLFFPPDLDQRAHAYMGLYLYKYERPDSFGSGSISPAERIYLPLPDDFTQEFGVSYGEQETGMIGAAAASSTGAAALNQFKQNLNKGESIFEGINQESITKNLGADTNQFLKYAGMSTLSSASSVIGGLVGQEAGMIANPHPSLFLNGVNLRQFTLTWTMVPRNATEAETIKQILKTIKGECLPKKKGSFLTYPKMIQPVIKNADFGQQYKKGMVQTISINYSAAGSSAFFVDGNPVAVQLTLGIQEAELFLEEIPESQTTGGN